jgi:hypothetical protein
MSLWEKTDKGPNLTFFLQMPVVPHFGQRNKNILFEIGKEKLTNINDNKKGEGILDNIWEWNLNSI